MQRPTFLEQIALEKFLLAREVEREVALQGAKDLAFVLIQEQRDVNHRVQSLSHWHWE